MKENQSTEFKWLSPYTIEPYEQYQYKQARLYWVTPEIQKKCQMFFQSIQCELAQKYFGRKKYWKLLNVIQLCGELGFFVETVDGAKYCFMIGKGAIKLSYLGISHHLTQKVDYYWNSTQDCWKCHYKVHLFVEQILRQANQYCPLKARKQDYEQSARGPNIK